MPEEVNLEGVAAAQAARKRIESTGDDVHVEDDLRVDELPSERAVAMEKAYVGSIRYGLAAIKNVGEAAMEAAIQERTANGLFKSLEDFCARVDSKKINKKSLECLVKCGAFDFVGADRAQLHSEIDAAMASAASAHRDRASGQISMFDDFATAAPAAAKRSAPQVEPWSHTEKLAFEKELLGFYVTGHPLDEYRVLLDNPKKFTPIAKLVEGEDKSTVTIGGALVLVEKKFTKKESKPFAVVVLEDLSSQLEVMIWNETFNKSVALLEQGNVVSITGRLDIREEGPRVTANEVRPVKKPAAVDRPLVLKFSRENTTEADLRFVRETLAGSPGMRRVEIIFADETGRRVRLQPGTDFSVTWGEELQSRLSPWLQP